MSDFKKVDQRLSIHEAVCAERYTEIDGRLQRIEKVLYWAAAAMISALAYIAWGVAASK